MAIGAPAAGDSRARSLVTPIRSARRAAPNLADRFFDVLDEIGRRHFVSSSRIRAA